jgi:hypothetical protein
MSVTQAILTLTKQGYAVKRHGARWLAAFGAESPKPYTDSELVALADEWADGRPLVERPTVAAIDQAVRSGDQAALAAIEAADLARCEGVIARGLQTFIEVGEALAEIREKRLYRATFGTFEDYCREKWGIGASRARQIIGAAAVAGTLTSVTAVTPANEAQLRPLAGLTPEQQRAAWQRAVEDSDGKPTAKHVEQAVREIVPPPLDELLLRLDAHGYTRVGTPTTRGSVTYHDFLEQGTGDELKLAEGELPYLLDQLDAKEAKAQERRAEYQDARDRFERLGYVLQKDSAPDRYLLGQPGKVGIANMQWHAVLGRLEIVERQAREQQATPAPARLPIALQQRLVAAGAAIFSDGRVLPPRTTGEAAQQLTEAEAEAALARWQSIPHLPPDFAAAQKRAERIGLHLEMNAAGEFSLKNAGGSGVDGYREWDRMRIHLGYQEQAHAENEAERARQSGAINTPAGAPASDTDADDARRRQWAAEHVRMLKKQLPLITTEDQAGLAYAIEALHSCPEGSEAAHIINVLWAYLDLELDEVEAGVPTLVSEGLA